MPNVFSIVLTNPLAPVPAGLGSLGPEAKAALILLGLETPDDEGTPERVTNVSRGMERVLAVPVFGSTWMTLMVSLRWPPAVVWLPNSLASAAVSPCRVSEPITSTLNGAPSATATQLAHLAVLIW